MSTPVPKTELVVNGRYTKKVIELINSAQFSIDLMMFEWRWYKKDVLCDGSLINQTLLRAMRRGVKVRGIVNMATQKNVLNEVGFNVRTNDAGTVLHSKSIIFDNKTVLLGSHNLTNNAMRSNIETSVLIQDELFAKQLSNYFEMLWLS